MSVRQFIRPYTSDRSNEATRMFDEVDRWRLAERFGIDRIHDKTRLQIYEAVAGGRGCAQFQRVMREITGQRDDELVYVNWDEFTQDHPEGAPLGSLKPLADTQRWLRDVIAKHCPFVQPSLNHGRIWLTAIPPEQTNGVELMNALRQGRDAFRKLSYPGDRNAMLNALVLAVPEIPKLPRWGSVRNYLGEYRQDFGEMEAGSDVTVGSFIPAEPVSAIADPRREAPPVFVFRHSLTRIAPAHPRRESLQQDGIRPF